MTGGPIVSSAAIGPDGTIFFGSSNTHVYALRPDGSQKWTRSVYNKVRSSPAIADGVLYIGSDANRLHAFDAYDGQILWEKDFGFDVIGSPAISADGTIYIGADDRKLHALNPDGSDRWAFLTGGSIRSTPVIDRDGRVFVGSSDRSFYAIRPNGTLLWKRATGLAIVSSAALGYHRDIYFGSTDGSLYAWGEKDVDNDPCLSWKDSDGDRTVDCVDLCVNDPSLTSPTAGCGCSCSGRGVCVADSAGGHCVCGADSSGPDCSDDNTIEAGTTSIQEVIPTDTAGRAVLNYVYLLYGANSPSLLDQARTALRAIPAAQLIALLRSSWAQARSATERGALLHALGVSNAPEALGLYDEILSASVAPELLDFDPHKKNLAREVAVLVRATAGVSRLAQLRIAGADSLLLDTVRHPLPPVRRYAAYSILKLGDAVLRNELRLRLLPGDEGFMQLRRATTNDIVLVRPPDPTPENDAIRGVRASEAVYQ